MEGGEGGEHRGGHRHRQRQGGAPAAEQEPQHGDAEAEADQRRDPQLPQGADHLPAAVRHHLDAQPPGVPPSQVADPFAHPGGEGDRVGLRGAIDAHQGPLPAVEAEKAAVAHLLERDPRHVPQHAFAPGTLKAQGAQGVKRRGVLPHQQGAHRRARPRPAGGDPRAHRF